AVRSRRSGHSCIEAADAKSPARWRGSPVEACRATSVPCDSGRAARIVRRTVLANGRIGAQVRENAGRPLLRRPAAPRVVQPEDVRRAELLRVRTELLRRERALLAAELRGLHGVADRHAAGVSLRAGHPEDAAVAR